MIKLFGGEFPPPRKAKPEAEPNKRGNMDAAAAAVLAALAVAPQAEAQPRTLERPAVESSTEQQVNFTEILSKLRDDFHALNVERDGVINPSLIPSSIFDERLFGPVTFRDFTEDRDGTTIQYRVFSFQYEQGQGSLLELRVSSSGEVSILSPIVSRGVSPEILQFNATNQPGSNLASRFDQAVVMLRVMRAVPAGTTSQELLDPMRR